MPVANVLDVLPEPALVVGTDGRIAFANRAAQARLGSEVAVTGDLVGLSPNLDAASDLRSYLVRCSGSQSPLPGAMDLREADGRTTRFRCSGGLLEHGRVGVPARVLLRLSKGDERFSVLAQKVRDLNEEVRRRRRTQALLEEALQDRDVMLRELHHRVKNNIHMLAGMLSAARRETHAPDAARVLEEAGRRLSAVGAVHQMLYRGDNLTGVAGDAYLTRIGMMVMQAGGASDRLAVEAEPVEVPNDTAVPLALILNELLTNALKHGIRADGTPGKVQLGLAAVDANIEVWVEDEGPGFDAAAEPGRRASGLGLVRGLTRQIGGAFSVVPGRVGGARCAVQFRSRRGAAAILTASPS
ncbi:sensor histidine kinase [Falsiroseomonas sp. E2-1-a20]|uniref:sensor histidine kinase n=1 Tax=Falsiroseomonas sp. E2-1-a20 TaxID=3239300 RepID=UPI003F36D25E